MYLNELQARALGDLMSTLAEPFEGSEQDEQAIMVLGEDVDDLGRLAAHGALLAGL